MFGSMLSYEWVHLKEFLQTKVIINFINVFVKLGGQISNLGLAKGALK
jgi:hypothetical protein